MKIDALNWFLLLGNTIIAGINWYTALKNADMAEKNRESVQLALEEIRAGRAHGIVVTKLDRLSRSLEELIKIMSDVRAAQGAFVCIYRAVCKFKLQFPLL